MTEATQTKPATKRPRRMAHDPKPELAADGPTICADATSNQPEKRPSKSAMVLDMLQRPQGASLDELVAATGWLRHTTRAALTGFKKKGHALTSEKVEGVRRYHVASSPDAGAEQ